MNEGQYQFRWVTAYHEAGHAAAHLFFGHRLGVVKLGDDPSVEISEPALDLDVLRDQDDTEKQVPIERMIVASMAGREAQRRFAPESVDDDLQITEDRLMEVEWFDALDTPGEVFEAYWRLLELRTQALVLKLWPQIQRIAEALIGKETLTGSEVEAVFRKTRIESV